MKELEPNPLAVDRVYFLGIGGIGMSALARYFRHYGASVAGYDLVPSSLTRELESEGMQVHYVDDVAMIPAEYRAPNPRTLVVYTPAVPQTNAEVQFFASAGHRLLKRAEILGLIADRHITLAVAGAHGKTTTTTLLAHLLASVRPCHAILGGVGVNLDSNLMLSAVPDAPLVVEADEYDRSFLQLRPHVTVITSVAPDHLDVYGSFEEVKSAFRAFALQNRRNRLIVHIDAACVFEGLGLELVTYGLGEGADYSASALTGGALGSHFRLHSPHRRPLDAHLGIPGRYNVENALAALAAADAVGVGPSGILPALASFRGVKRRFQVCYASDSVIYVDDYAHHPEEVRAFVEAAREAYAGRRILGIFQPHLYTRTRDFASEFAAALGTLDEVWLLPIYPARELPIQGVSSSMLLEQIKAPARRSLVDMESLVSRLRDEPGLDVVLTMGAGSIGTLAASIVRMLQERERGHGV